MQLFRKHIILCLACTLLVSGLLAHSLVPLSDQAQRTSFTQWLDRHVAESDHEESATIRDHIRQLPLRYDTFSLLLEQASILVSSHQNDFKLPLQHSDTNEDLDIWLIDKWSRHQSDTGQMETLLPESVKSVLKWVVQKPSLTGTLKEFSNGETTLLKAFLNRMVLFFQHQPLPFLSGSSINAP